VIIFKPRPLYPEKEIPMLIGYTGLASEFVWTQWRRERIPSPAENQTTVIQLVA